MAVQAVQLDGGTAVGGVGGNGAPGGNATSGSADGGTAVGGVGGHGGTGGTQQADHGGDASGGPAGLRATLTALPRRNSARPLVALHSKINTDQKISFFFLFLINLYCKLFVLFLAC